MTRGILAAAAAVLLACGFVLLREASRRGSSTEPPLAGTALGSSADALVEQRTQAERIPLAAEEADTAVAAAVESDSPVEPEEPEKSRLVRGIVYEGNWGAVAEGSVEIHAPKQPWRLPQELQLSPDGTFQCSVPINVEVWLRAELPNGAVGLRSVKPHSTGRPLEVALHAFPRGSLSGRLVDRAGRGLAGLGVHGKQSTQDLHATEAHRTRPPARSRADGSFRIDDLRLAPTNLVASTFGRGWPLAENLAPSDDPNGTYELPLIRLEVSAVLNGIKLPLHATRSNWAPAGKSALTFEPVDGGWIGRLADAQQDTDSAYLLVEPQHAYSLKVVGANHELLVHELSLVDTSDDQQVLLHLLPRSEPVSVELVVEDPGNLIGEDFLWSLSALRDEMHLPIDLPPATKASHAPLRLQLSPGKYLAGIQFRLSPGGKDGLGDRDVSWGTDLPDAVWSFSSSIDVEGSGSFVLRTEDARPPLPPGLFGPGDY